MEDFELCFARGEESKQQFKSDALIYAPSRPLERCGSKIDFIDYVWNGKTVKVVGDRKHYPNFFIENKSDKNDGWLQRSRADLLAYGFHMRGVWYVFDLKSLRHYIDHRPRLRIGTAFTPQINAEPFATTGLLLPITEAERDAAILEAFPMQLARASA